MLRQVRDKKFIILNYSELKNTYVRLVESHILHSGRVTKAGLLGDVALTVVAGNAAQENGASVGTAGAKRNVGENIYGPFEAGFGTQQDSVITGQMGCPSKTPCYSEGQYIQICFPD